MNRRANRNTRRPRQPADHGTATPSPFTVTPVEGTYVVHREARFPERLADVATALRDDSEGRATLLVGTVPADDELDEFARRLAPVVGELSLRDVRLLVLVMSQGAVDRAAAPSPARRLCEDWGLEVVAPSGRAVVVPGGTLFSPDGATAPGGWWQFSPGLVPRRLGARFPVPDWEAQLARMDAEVADGHLVTPVPAGLLVRPAGVPAGGTDGIEYAVPVDPGRPQLLVGVAGAPPVSADALAGVLAALPGRVRGAVRLLPADGRDLLAVGQETADALGLEVEVASGLPVLLEDDSVHAAARTVLVGPDGAPAWEPYVESVLCAPTESGGTPEPRVGSWRAPATGLEEGPEPGVFLLDDRWRTSLTRAGLWVGRHGDRPPLTARPADSDVMAIDLGVPGRALDDSLWPALDLLFAALEGEARERAMIQVHGHTSADGMRALRRLAVRHGMVLAPKGWRSGAAQEEGAQVLAAPLSGVAAPRTEPPAARVPSAQVPAAPPVQYVTTTGGTAPTDHSLGAVPVPAADSGRGPDTGHLPYATAAAGLPRSPAPAAGTGASAGTHPAPGTAEAVPAQSPLPAPAVTPAPVPPEPTAPPAPPRPPAAAPSAQEPDQEPDQADADAYADDPYVPDWPPPVAARPATTEPVAEPEPFTPLFTSSDAVLGGPGATAPWSAWPESQGTGQAGLEEGVEHADGGRHEEGREGGDLACEEHRGGTSTEPEAGTSDDGGIGEDGWVGAHRGLVEGTPEEDGPSAARTVPPEPAGAVLRELSHVPIAPSHRSSPSERQALRSHLGADWERHAGAVQRALTRLPGLRSAGREDDELTADLTALYAYLSAGEGRLDERGLSAGLDRRDPGALAYLGCLASALRRLPSFRGAAVRTAGVFDEATRLLLPGEELGAAVPVSASGLDDGYPSLPDDHYLIWSATGRRIGSLGDSDSPFDQEEVVFGPGTRFRVLDVRERAGARVVLLRELAGAVPPAVPGHLDTSDAPVLDRLVALADRPAVPRGEREWPARCDGLLGLLPETPHTGAPPG
ncbi:hypothetical protein GCM10010238_67730 [Streptomyces griseoviridis]|uniref:NAD(+)--protein-arginine ADP-ribosyltransferase n=1 Tax=Streptomyces griseoviridis TaxID=45398 RepID=A0A918LLJ1_STRGD|nr:hypothetical protein GCM10010238_67730 [Streptomyces niveoruber]